MSDIPESETRQQRQHRLLLESGGAIVSARIDAETLSALSAYQVAYGYTSRQEAIKAMLKKVLKKFLKK